MKTFYSFILLIMISVSSCSSGLADNIKGSGKVQKEQRQITPFSKVSVSTAVQLIITQGPALPNLTVEAEDNILPYIETKVEGNTLHIGINNKSKHQNLNPTKPMKVYVTVIEISEFEGSSASKITGTNTWKANTLKIDLSSASSINMTVEAKELDIEVSSAAKAEITGTCTKLEMDVNSAAKVDAEGLVAENADIDVSSAASASVKVTEKLSYDVSSAGKLNYSGSPRIEKAEVDKSGKVSHK